MIRASKTWSNRLPCTSMLSAAKSLPATTISSVQKAMSSFHLYGTRASSLDGRWVCTCGRCVLRDRSRWLTMTGRLLTSIGVRELEIGEGLGYPLDRWGLQPMKVANAHLSRRARLLMIQ